MEIAIVALGLVSESCSECKILREKLKKDFSQHEFELNFIDLSFDDDPDGAIEVASSFGLTSVPSFLIGNVVFTEFYNMSDVDSAISNLENHE